MVTVTRLGQHLGFDESSKGHLLDGKVLSSGGPDEEQEKSEMSVSWGMLLVRRGRSEWCGDWRWVEGGRGEGGVRGEEGRDGDRRGR